jgi:hypothetical protein
LLASGSESATAAAHRRWPVNGQAVQPVRLGTTFRSRAELFVAAQNLD